MKKRSKPTKPKSSKSKGFRTLGGDEPRKVSRGEDMYGYGEQKKRRSFALTDTVDDFILKASRKAGLSKSEFLERWVRNEMAQTLDTK